MNRDKASSINIVLVGTLYSGNIGSAARAMMNMGIHDLRLVNPEAVITNESRNMAVNAWKMVESAPVYTSLSDAVSGSALVIGTTCQRGRDRDVREYTPREVAPLIKRAAMDSAVSIVFGPERGGLTKGELGFCQYLINIPASPELPTLNLAQAVLIVCYELFACEDTGGGGTPISPGFEYPTHQEREQMFDHIESTLLNIGFLSSSNPAHIMLSLRRLLGSEKLARRDIRIIRGIMSRMDWYVENGRSLPPERIRKP